MHYGIAVNTENCMACYNCVMACKDEHCGFSTTVSAPQPHEGQFWVNIQTKERGDDNRKVKTSNVPVLCSHCEKPACVDAAHNGAAYKRADGIVILDPEKARGQKQIAAACPIGAVYWNEALQLPQKCTMCAHLLDEGYKQPRCVEACPNEALFFGDLDDPESKVSKVITANRRTPLKPLEGQKTGVTYLNIPTVFLAGSVYLAGDESGEDPAEHAEVILTNQVTGEVRKTRTNYFGDWEFELLVPNAQYLVKIQLPGYQTVEISAATDTDHYLGEVVLETE